MDAYLKTRKNKQELHSLWMPLPVLRSDCKYRKHKKSEQGSYLRSSEQAICWRKSRINFILAATGFPVEFLSCMLPKVYCTSKKKPIPTYILFQESQQFTCIVHKVLLHEYESSVEILHKLWDVFYCYTIQKLVNGQLYIYSVEIQ